MLGFAEQLEFLATLPDAQLEPCGGRSDVESLLLDAARATCDHYIDVAAADGVPYWDAGAPGLAELEGWGDRPADPFNDHEPVDSSAAAIGAQGLLRLAHLLERRGRARTRDRYRAGWTPRARHTLLPSRISASTIRHQGLLLHSVYHWPNGWDHVPPGARTPRGESSQWGDYHAREAALYVKRLAEGANLSDVLRTESSPT